MSDSSTPGAPPRISAPRSGEIGRSNSALIESECPVNTGTRTHVTDTGRSGISRILRLSLRSFCSSLVSSEPSSTSAPANGSTLNAIGRANFAGAGKSTASPSNVSAAAPSTTLRTCSSNSATPARPGARHRLVGADDEPLQAGRHDAAASAPASRPWSCSSGWRRCPSGDRSSVCGLTSATTSGTSGSIRHADELSITITPAAANRGRERPRAGRSGREQRDVEPGRVGGGGVFDRDLVAVPRQRAPDRPSRGEVAQLVDREAPLGEDRPHDATDLAGCSYDAYTHGRTGYRRPSAPNPAVSARLRRRARTPSCRACTDRSTSSAATTQRDADRRGRDHLDVDAVVGQRLEHRRRDARVGLHAGADQRDPADVLVVRSRRSRRSRRRAHRSPARSRHEVGLRHRERDVGGPADRRVLHDHVDVHRLVGEGAEQSRRDAGLVGHPVIVTFASDGVVGDGGDDRVLPSRHPPR